MTDDLLGPRRTYCFRKDRYEWNHYEPWKPIYFGQGYETQKKIAGEGHGTLVSAGLSCDNYVNVNNHDHNADHVH